MLFMGEEWGATTPWQFFTAHPEPELGRATAARPIEEFARMGWDPAVVPDPQDGVDVPPLELALGRSSTSPGTSPSSSTSTGRSSPPAGPTRRSATRAFATASIWPTTDGSGGSWSAARAV